MPHNSKEEKLKAFERLLDVMDTLREKQQIERLWESGNAPWKLWE